MIVRDREILIGALTMPKAEKTLGMVGKTISGIPTSAASAAAC